MAKAHTLIIVESPTKARTISRFLSSSFQVKASLGHVRDLPKSRLGVNLEADFEPDYITIRGKGVVLKELRAAVKKVKHVFLATDPDREGEAISWHLAQALGLDLDADIRIEFHEITAKAVKEAFKKPRKLDLDYIDAQQARRVLDRIYGYQLSPFLWRKIRYGLSAGRVQSVALRLICEREEEIACFEPQEYWKLGLKLTSGTNELHAHLLNVSGEKPLLNCEEDVQQLIKAVPSSFIAEKVKHYERARQPAAPYITSSLQQDAVRRLGFNAQKTMRLAQQLYEGVDVGEKGAVGLITYMRTDSTIVAEEAFQAAKAYLEGQYGTEYTINQQRRFPQRKGAQQAHEAIRPSDVLRTPESLVGYLSRDLYRLYKMIWERFLASTAAAALMDAIQVDLPTGKMLFRISGSVLRFKGFLAIFADEEERDTNEHNFIPQIVDGQELILQDIVPSQHFTQPPPRYGEALLIKTMEELGIGRPSTYATTIDTLVKRNYLKSAEKRFFPTELGVAVNKLLCDHFNMVVETEFTAQMEEALDAIEEGQRSWREVVADFYDPFSQLISQAEIDVPAIEVADEITEEVCPVCGSFLAIKRGRFGNFLACTGYPECDFTKSIVLDTGVCCPECGKGTLLERKSKKGQRRFFGCSAYPECSYLIWEVPHKRICPECGHQAASGRPMKRTQMMRYTCLNANCGHIDFVPLEKEIEDEEVAEFMET